MAQSVSVLPIFDSMLGTVCLNVDGQWERFIAPHPQDLDYALANTAGRPVWESDSCALTVRIPRAHRPDGEAQVFFLERLPVRDHAEAPSGMLVG
ncbi:hypothetical protein ACTXOR_13500 [Arthrobacter rhombi]|uniref:Uncharacterized protein n=2 Tax=Arthrobacter rhombi TaxID=71253 RepID=A0A1R4FHW1_9MICC|nr:MULTISPECIES: hypothetical protein [Micrococcaceae]PCC26404.1 hypothetical protein CIK75_03060 [Glutamicibacter sp. BW78]SJM55486.1 hypothetical protein FM101_04000 [Arthrobacter rhombi]